MLTIKHSDGYARQDLNRADTKIWCIFSISFFENDCLAWQDGIEFHIFDYEIQERMDFRTLFGTAGWYGISMFDYQNQKKDGHEATLTAI